MFKQLYDKYRDMIPYMIFGVLTTLVNIAAYWLLAHPLGLPTVPSTVIAWVLAVLFAYVTNRKWVFHSEAKTRNEIIKEGVSFYLCRLLENIGLPQLHKTSRNEYPPCPALESSFSAIISKFGKKSDETIVKHIFSHLPVSNIAQTDGEHPCRELLVQISLSPSVLLLAAFYKLGIRVLLFPCLFIY